MKVGIWSNAHTACGNAEYGRALYVEMQKYFETKCTADVESLMGQVEAVVINWHPARIECPPNTVQRLQAAGSKVLMILQNSNECGYYAQEQDPIRFADAVVSHQKMDCNVTFEVIPHGIPVVDGLREPQSRRLGIAGFPYAWKRFDVTALAAERIQGRSLLIAPLHEMGDVHTTIQKIQGACPSAEIVRELLPVDEVVRRLSECSINVFWYKYDRDDDLTGQSGSVGLGLAAKRPMIVSDHPKLRTLQDYSDDVYIVGTEEEVYTTVEQLTAQLERGEEVKTPKRILADMSWEVAGKMYRDRIERMMAA